MRTLDFSDGFESESTPSQGSLTANALKVFANDAAFISDKGSAAATGDEYWNSTNSTLRAFDGSSWVDVGPGAGGGGGGGGGSLGINYVTASSGDATTGWGIFADPATTVPDDGVGGSANITLSSDSVNALRGGFSFKLSKDSVNRQGEGANYDFTIDRADKGKKLKIQFDYEVFGSFVAGDNSDVGVWIYDKDLSSLIEPSQISLLASKGTYQVTFNTTDSINYRLVFFIRTTNASSWDLRFDSVIVGPELPINGSAQSDWIGFTPTGGWTTNTTYEGLYRRIGDTMEVIYRVDLTGAPNAANLTLNTPSGFSIDTTKLVSGIGSSQIPMGEGYVQDSGTTRYKTHAFYQNATTFGVGTIATSGSFGTRATTTNTSPITFGSGDLVVVYAKAPMVGWSTNAVLENARTFRMGNILSNGTQVSGSDPSNLGEYRLWTKDVSANTFTEDATAPTPLPTTADGMKVFGVAYNAAGSAGSPNKWVIFVGKNRHVEFEFFTSAGRTGTADVSLNQQSSTDFLGTGFNYDPTTGLAVVDCGTCVATTTTTRKFGCEVTKDGTAGTDPTDGYFDIVVTDAPISVEAKHASSHEQSGIDPLDGDKLGIDWNPSNYTPDSGIPEADNIDQLAAHLNGIDAAIGAGITNQVATATGTTSTTSATMVALSGMAITPAAGTYLVLFSSSGFGSASNAQMEYEIQKITTQQTGSFRRTGVNTGSQNNTTHRALHSMAVVTVTGSDEIRVTYRTSAGTFTVNDRALILIKLS